MGWESFGVVGFDLRPLVQGQTRIAKLKGAYNSLITRAASEPENTPRFLVLEESPRTRLIA